MRYTLNREIWHGASLGTVIMIQEEPFWDHVGTILERIWDYFGTILVPFWDHFRTICFGTILGPFWDHFGTVFEPF